MIGLYNEFLNGTKTEEALVNDMEAVIPLIDNYYFHEIDLAIPPIELNEWSQCSSNLSASIHDLTLFYNKMYLPSRTPDNRIACMNMTVSRYYEDLEVLKKIGL